MALSADPRIGSELAGYRIERLLGRGGMSVVYLAEDTRLHRRVALKLLAPELAEDERFRERFLRESRLAASIDHPNVIPIYEAGETEGVLFIAMRYVQGNDLRRLLGQEGRLEPARAVAILAQVADALDEAHAHGLVHRDVKPGNVLLAAREHVYLSDFGLTKQAGSESGITETGQFVGTVDYVAPEQIQRQPVSPQTDVYALGCVLYECLAGEPPYRSDSLPGTLFAHVSAEPPRPSEQRSGLPAGIDAVVARALAKEPRERHRTCREVVADARAALGLTQISEAAARTPGRRRLLVALAVLLIGIGAAVAVVLLTSGGGGDTTTPVLAGPTSLIRIDPATNELDTAVNAGIPLLSFPALAVAGEAVWLADQVGHTVSRFDAGTGTLTRTSAVRGSPRDIAVGAGGVWVIGTEEGEGTLIKIDPATGTPRGTFDLPYSDPVAVTADENSVWIAANDLDGNAVLQVASTEPDRAVKTIPFETRLLDIAGGEDAIWTTSGGSRAGTIEAAVTATRIDAETGRVVATIDLGHGGFTAVGALAVAEGTGWTLAGDGVVRFDTRTDTVSATIPFAGNDLYGIAADAVGVWVCAGDQPGRLLRIDPDNNTLVAQINKLNKATVVAVAVGDSGVWAY